MMLDTVTIETRELVATAGQVVWALASLAMLWVCSRIVRAGNDSDAEAERLRAENARIMRELQGERQDTRVLPRNRRVDYE